MSIDNVISIIISILGSSVITLVLSTFVFQPMQDRKKYIFDEKKRVYEPVTSQEGRKRSGIDKKGSLFTDWIQISAS